MALPTLFEDDFAIIDPETDVEVQFIDHRKRVVGEDRTEPGSGWFFLFPDTDRWKGPFASESQARMETHSELHERELAAVEAAFEAAGFERNLYFGRNANFRSYHRRHGDGTIVISEAAESLTVYRIPDGETETVQSASIGVDDIRSADFHVVDLIGGGKARTVRIDPSRHLTAVIGKPDIESAETYGHEVIAVREATQRVSEWNLPHTP
jgi:hypothetical protein